ncbi:MAG: type I DNA topoisomerase [Spirochaetales bacterium]|nr:type I DNA topoisomerase [Spirochaetales bacterium]
MDFDSKKKTLVIVESPTKANTIRKFLPRNFSVIASEGHFRDLPETKLGVDADRKFKITYVIDPKKRELVAEMKKKLEKSEQLLLATDEDREGEAISWHLLETLKPKVPYQRMVFHEITKEAVTEALKKGRDLDMNLVHAQEDRRVIDRLYGYEVSPILWRKLSNKNLSAGRVQSVGLRYICDKEMERLSFISSVWFDLKASLEKGGKVFAASLESIDGKRIAGAKDFDPSTGALSSKARLLTEEDAERLLETLKSEAFTVLSVEEKPKKQSPYPPFTTSTLQQAASSRLKMKSSETMQIAQRLFERGFITYMRTDSVNLSSQCIHASREKIAALYGEAFLSPNERRFRTTSAGAQEAHEAIRPAGSDMRTPEETGLSGRDLQLYRLIWQRTMATQMANADKLVTSVKIGAKDAVFAASGTVIKFPGFLKVYGSDETEEGEENIPNLSEGETLELESLESKKHETTPPQRYTEAGFIKKLEEEGIGRPSTYASIITTLLDREYSIELNGSIIPTFLGFAVYDYLLKEFPVMMDYKYTADMESKLDRVAGGEEDKLAYLADFYFGSDGKKGLKANVKEALLKKDDYKTLEFPNLSGRLSLDDGREISYQIKVGPYGAYLLTDIVGEDGKAVIVNIPSRFCPGVVTDKELASLVLSNAKIAAGEDPDAIVLKHGSFGDYWSKGGKTVNVPKGKKSAESYTEEEIEFLFSLPLNLGQDSNGNDIILNNGRYGAYLSCGGKNTTIRGSIFDMDHEKAIALLEGPDLNQLEPYLDRPLEIKSGRYGYYLKWGSENIALPFAYRKNPEKVTQEIAEKLCGRTDETKAPQNAAREFGLFQEKALSIVDGKYGPYIKWGSENIPIPAIMKDNISAITEEDIHAAALAHGADKSFGDVDGKPLGIYSGRYGYYMKWGDANIKLPDRYKESFEGITAEEAIEIARSADVKTPAKRRGRR